METRLELIPGRLNVWKTDSCSNIFSFTLHTSAYICSDKEKYKPDCEHAVSFSFQHIYCVNICITWLGCQIFLATSRDGVGGFTRRKKKAQAMSLILHKKWHLGNALAFGHKLYGESGFCYKVFAKIPKYHRICWHDVTSGMTLAIWSEPSSFYWYISLPASWSTVLGRIWWWGNPSSIRGSGNPILGPGDSAWGFPLFLP